MFLLCCLFASSWIYSQGAPAQLPEIIKDILDKELPGWKFYKVDEAYDYSKDMNVPFRPNFIWGDFDGDGERDYAVQITRVTSSNAERIVIAFLQRGKSSKNIF